MYDDIGVHVPSLEQLDDYVCEFFTGSYKHISANELKRQEWMSHATILIIGGGADIPYHKRLRGIGCKNIKEFVANGGIYIGICAGAYFGSSKLEFALGTEIEICDERELKFFPGTASGPCLKPYVYTSEEGACAAKLISNNNLEFFAYYNGGCLFEHADNMNNVEVIARYADLNNRPAVIKCNFGKGFAILSGVHFEYSPKFYKTIDNTGEITKQIEATNSSRIDFIKYLVRDKIYTITLR